MLIEHCSILHKTFLVKMPMSALPSQNRAVAQWVTAAETNSKPSHLRTPDAAPVIR